jgi:hypothetical protein
MSGLTPFCDARILRSAASRAASSSSTDAPLPMPICIPNAFILPIFCCGLDRWKAHLMLWVPALCHKFCGLRCVLPISAATLGSDKAFFWGSVRLRATLSHGAYLPPFPQNAAQADTDTRAVQRVKPLRRTRVKGLTRSTQEREALEPGTERRSFRSRS